MASVSAGTPAPEKIKTGRNADNRILAGFISPCYRGCVRFSG